MDRRQGIFGIAIPSADFHIGGINPSRIAASGSHRYQANHAGASLGGRSVMRISSVRLYRVTLC